MLSTEHKALGGRLRVGWTNKAMPRKSAAKEFAMYWSEATKGDVTKAGTRDDQIY